MIGPFGKPLSHARVTGGWGDSRPANVGYYHYALDMAAPAGTPIFAVQDGEVVLADHAGSATAGKYVVVKSGGVASRYLHMSQVLVNRGQHVTRGQKIGLVGSTGLSSAPHLHLDMFLSAEKLAEYKQTYGTPTPTYPAPRNWGTQVPAEALIPVDSYTDTALRNAAKRDVKLYSPDPIVPLIVAGVFGYMAYRLYKK